MKKTLLLTIFSLFLLVKVFAQGDPVTTNGGSGLAASYASLSAAITALNAATITSPVVITLTGNETAPVGGYSITATGTETNTITINGISSTITAPTPQTSGSLHDAIFEIIGGDYITINGFTMAENPSNTTTTAASNNMTEFGVALFYATTTNGAQFNTIKNCTISLNRTYQNTFGIYSNSTHSATVVTTSATATTSAGGNSGLKIYGNSISNVNQGIVVVGPTAAADHNAGLDIGGTGGIQANTISNYGTTGTFSGYANVSGSVYGVLVRNTRNFNVSYNSITSSNGGTTSGTLRGIYVISFSSAPTGTLNNSINNNSLSVTTGVASGTVQGITVESSTGTATSSLSVKYNNFTNMGYNVASPTGGLTLISVAMANLNTYIENNTFTNLTVTSTGSVTFISHSYTVPATGIQSVSNNSIVTGFSKTGAGGTVTLATSSSSSGVGTTINHNNNNFSNITVTGATTIAGWSNTDGGAANKTFSGNTFSNWTGGTSAVTVMNINYGGNDGGNGNVITGNTITNITGQGAITGISLGSSQTVAKTYLNTISGLSSTGTGGTVTGISTAAPTASIYQNQINTLSTANTSGIVYGINCTGGTTVGLYRNKIYDLLATAAGGTVNGINISLGTTYNINNNMIGDLRVPAGTGLNAIIGINASATSTYNIFYNSIYLNASSTSATTFGNSCINFSSTATALNLRNNILVNLSTPAQNGANTAANGIAACLRRSSGTTGTIPANYSTASNNNAFWCNPSAGTNNHLTYVEGTSTLTNPKNTLADFQVFTTNRDQVSVEVNPPFISTDPTSSDFLHISTASSTSIESGGAKIDGIDVDFDGNTRQGSAGYTGTGTAPDIGADEFEGIPSYTCVTPNPGNTLISATNICLGTSVTMSLENSTAGTGVSYQWQSSEDGSSFTNISGAVSSSYTVTPLTALYYQCVVTCNKEPISFNTSNPVQVTFANSVLSTTPNTRCGSGTTDLEATVSSGTATWYDAATGGNKVGTGSPFTTPTISATTTFYVADVTQSPGQATLGAGASTSSGYQGPFYYLYGGEKSQYLIKGSELAAAGLSAGDITALALDVTQTGAIFNSFTLSMGNTALSALTSTFQTGLTPVYSAGSINPTIGIFTITFSTPFNWDGSSNVIIEFCWSNNNGGGSPHAHVKYDATAFVATTYNRADNSAPATFCAGTSGYGTYSSRPKMIINGTTACASPRLPVIATVLTPPAITATATPDALCTGQSSTLEVTSPNDPNYDYTWTPGDLIGASHIVTPGATTVYTVNAYDDATGCATNANVTVTVNSYPDPFIITPTSAQVPSGGIQMLTASNSPALEEGFNEPTNNWTTINNSTGGAPLLAAWTLQADGYGGAHSNDNSQFYMSDSDLQGSGGTTATILQSPSFSTVGYGALAIQFYHFYSHWTGSAAKVEISSDGSNWTTLQTYSATTGTATAFAAASIPVPGAFMNQPSVYIRFKFDAVWGYYWLIDNVKIFNPATADYTWSPLTYLYSDAAATVAYAGEVTPVVYSKPLATTVYTATATATGGCSITNNVTVESCPETPADIQVTATVNNGFTVEWSSVQGAHGTPLVYTLEVTSDAAFQNHVGASPYVITDPTVSQAVTGLAANTIYYYRIKAASECESGYTSGSVTTCAGDVTGLAASNVAYTAFDLSWNAPAGGGAEPIVYTIDVATDAGFASPVAGSPFTVNDPVTSLSLTGLTSNITYYYRVMADAACAGNYVSGNVLTSTCQPPTGFTAAATSGSTAYLAWSAASVPPPVGYEYEVRTSGAAGSGPVGLAASGVTPNLFAAITGLTTSTAYTAYVRSACDPSTFTPWLSATFTTSACGLATIPYFEGLESYTPPTYGCLTVEDIDFDAVTWYTANNASLAKSGTKFLTIQKSLNPTIPLNDWVYTQGLSVEEGRSYKVNFWYRARSSSSTEKLEVKWGGAPMASAMSATPIFTNGGFTSMTYLQGTGTFTVPYTGAFWVGWHAYSDPLKSGIYVDDISICELPDDAGTIDGPVLVCRPQTSLIYTVPTIEDATSYFWTVPTGATIVSGQGTSAITVDYPLESVSGNVTVYGINSCGNGAVATLAVDVYPQLPVSVSITADYTTVCEGETVTLEATPVNGGPNPSYQWKVNGSDVGNDQDTYSFIPIDNDEVTVVLTSDAICAIDNPATSNAIDITVIPQLVVGSISANETICEGHAPALLEGVPPSTGNSPTYQWYQSVNNVDFTEITGATDLNYQPGNLSVTTWFRQAQNALVTCGGPLNTNVVTITVIPTVGTPDPITISSGSDPVCQLTNGTTTTTYTTAATNSTGLNWSVSNPAAGSIAANGVMTWTEGFFGSVDIEVTANGCNGPSAKVTRTVIVTPTVGTPTAITVAGGTEPECQLIVGSLTTTYATTATDNTGFNWSVTNPAAGSIDPVTGVMSWTDGFTGTVDIQVTASGCNGPSAMVYRTVNVTPTVGTPTAITISAGTEPSCQLTNATTTTTYYSSAAYSTSLVWSISDPAAGIIDATGLMTWTDGYYGTVDIQVQALGCNGPSAQVVRTVVVNQNLPVSITISTPQTVVCDGTEVTFTAIPVNGGITPVYQWKLNGNDAGTNSNTYVMTPEDGDAISCILTSDATCATGNPATSNTVDMTVNPNLPVSITIERDANNVCAGTIVNFEATAVNAGLTPEYQWFVNGTEMGTNSPYFSYQPENLDVVTCELTSSEACASGNPATSNELSMIVNPVLPVSITIVGSANNICQGTSVTFTATGYNGGGTPLYQWKVNNVNKPGATNTTYIYVPANNDEVTCELTSSIVCSSNNPATSNQIVMIVNAPQPVSITIAPNANPVCAGTQVTFTATPVNGGSSPSYQWRVNGSRIGSNSPTMSYIPSNNDVVTCRLTSNATCITGNPATSPGYTMTVNPIVAVSVSIAADQTTVCEGETVNLTATPVGGGASPAYQWQVNSSDVPGATNATFAHQPINGDVVKCVLTSSVACPTVNPATSNAITLTVNPILNIAVNITADDESVCEGTEVNLEAHAVDAGPSPTYQWRLNGNNITGATNAAYAFIPANNDAVTCVVSSTAPCTIGNPAVSNTITFTVNPYVEVSVYIEPNLNPICEGATAVFTAYGENGGTSPQYQWILNNTPVVGVAGPVYSFVPNAFDKVSVVMTSSETCTYGNVVSSDTIVMNVYPYLPVGALVTSSPIPACQGSTLNFWVDAVNGGYQPAYQWKKNGNNISGATSTTYSYTPANGDQISCQVTSSYLCPTGNPAQSNVIDLTFMPNLTVSVTIDADIVPVTAGVSTTFTATGVNEGANPVYQWFVNGMPSGSDNSVFVYTPVVGDEISCELTSDYVCALNNPATSNTLKAKAENVSVEGVTVNPAEVVCYDAANTIIIAENAPFMIENGGSATMIAGQKIVYMPGTTVKAGGYMHGYISATDYCGQLPTSLVSAGIGTKEEQPVVVEKAEFVVYPNPTNGNFTLEIKGDLPETALQVEIFTMQGERIMSNEFNGLRKQLFVFGEMPAGLYFVKIVSGNEVTTIKLIKSR